MQTWKTVPNKHLPLDYDSQWRCVGKQLHEQECCVYLATCKAPIKKSQRVQHMTLSMDQWWTWWW